MENAILKKLEGNSERRQFERTRVHAKTDNFTIHWKIEPPPEYSLF